MQHKMLVRGLHNLCDPQKQAEYCLSGQGLFRAEAVDRDAVQIFQHQVRAAIRRDTSIQQASDPRVRKVRENLLLLVEPLHQPRRKDALLQNLDGDFFSYTPSARSARYTAPMPPRPSSERSRYGPSTVPSREDSAPRMGGRSCQLPTSRISLASF